MTKRHTAALCAVLLCCLAALPALADEMEEGGKLFRQGNHAQALDKVNGYLAAHPRDARARFLKGLILSEQNKPGEAIKIFSALTEDYPELPEPYNNLAVLYAAQGQYEKARTALEMAIRTHPSYATAHENLGDIYAKMATQAYDKALQLERGNATAQAKLELIRELFSGSHKAEKPAAKTGTVAPPAESAPSPPRTSPAPAAPAPAAPQESARTAPPLASSAGDAEVLKTVQEWAQAWSRQDAATYLGFYAREFKVPGVESRAAWEAARRERITRPKKIEVALSSPRVHFRDTAHATVSFEQQYRSDTLKSSSQKTLALVKSSGKWLIVQEQIVQ